MPNLLDIAQSMSERPAVTLANAQRCLSERDLRATCSCCADACPADAVSFAPGSLDFAAAHGSVGKPEPTGPRIDDDACVRCGACVTSCPTGALASFGACGDDVLLLDVERVGRAATAAAQACACVACERAVQATPPDPERTVRVPCLGWMDEALVVHLAVSGARRIFFLTGQCDRCPLSAAVQSLPKAMDGANRIFNAWKIEARVEAEGEPPAELAMPAGEAVDGVSRRDMLAQARAAFVDAAVSAASVQAEVSAAEAIRPESIDPDRRRWQLLDDLHAAGLPDEQAVVPRCIAPRVDIDVERCSGCAHCALFCPTGALDKVGKAAGGKTVLEFDAALCRDCGVCADTCRYGALTCDETLTVEELFDFAPREIVVPKRRVLPSA